MSVQKTVMVGDVPLGEGNPIAFILGPCQLENRAHAMMMAERVSNACKPTGSKFIFKASFDKANRSSIKSARDIGIEEGLPILSEVRDTFG
jgi:2-dehydro-3-deoxyphosphooctonate aldolase (KDO 8-P synthase)